MAKSKINIDNYEAWFLDYVEGNLDEAGRAEVVRFASAHPELACELDIDFSELKLAPEQDTVFSATSLKVTETGLDSLDELMISDVEGLLNANQKSELDKIIAKKGLKRNFGLYRNTVLKPINSEKFGLTSSILCNENFSIHSRNEDEMMIAATEGLLLPNEANFVNAYVEEHQLENKLRSFEVARLTADKSLVYDADKKSLKRRTGVVIPFYVRIAAAAAVIATLFFIPFNNESNDIVESDPVENPVSGNYYFARLNAKETRPTNENYSVEENFVDHNSPNNHVEQNFVAIHDDQKVKQDTSRIKTEETLPMDIADDIISNDSLPGLDQIDPNPINDDIVAISNTPILAPRYRSDEPIGLITNFANAKLGTDIAFTRKKDLKSDEYIAYHVKFGRFEFERKKSR